MKITKRVWKNYSDASLEDLVLDYVDEGHLEEKIKCLGKVVAGIAVILERAGHIQNIDDVYTLIGHYSLPEGYHVD